MLGKLLHSLCQQTLDEDMEVHIVVVDNDAAGSACEVVERYAATSEMNVRYEKEPVQNIALARNRALSLCAGDYIAFIDDDEEATSEWLRHLLHTARKFEADTVFGPVVPVYPDNTQEWVRRGRFFERARYQTGTLCSHGGAGNVLLSRKALASTGARFDPTYGRTGGEDTNFFYRLGQQGARMVWCDEALVHEAVPEDRMTPTWLIKRAYRGGQMHARLFISPKPPLARVPWVAQRVTYLTAALLALPLAWLWGKEKGVRVLMKISSNFGHLTSLTGWFYEGYR
jgi:succinoglycan biosynthesis protein ExoM